VITVRGEIDRSNVAELTALATSATKGTGSSVILDVAGVTFIDGGVLGLIYDLVETRRREEWVGILSPSSAVSRLLEISGLIEERALRVLDRTDEGFAVIKKRCA
jgi:anti-anti-sigma factor